MQSGAWPPAKAVVSRGMTWACGMTCTSTWIDFFSSEKRLASSSTPCVPLANGQPKVIVAGPACARAGDAPTTGIAAATPRPRNTVRRLG